MIIRKKYGSLLFIFIVVYLFVSCRTFDHKNPYQSMEIAHYGNSHAYVFMNELSDRLIINIDGSGWDSTLGTKNKRRWTTTKNGAQLLQVLGDKYTFFIPEKFRREPGLTYYEDMGDRADYTADNLLNCYIESINGYLSEHSFSSIILIGTSEGAMLLPLIYDRMNNKDMVKALVSISFGGLSLYESYSILYIYPDLHSDYKAMYQYFLLAFEPGKTDYPDSFKEDVFGITYRWFNSFKDIKPFDYYKNINIPVLFVHGDYDYNIPVESTTFIQENLSEKPFTYKYFQWAHQPEKYSDIITFRNEVAEWVIQNDLAME